MYFICEYSNFCIALNNLLIYFFYLKLTSGVGGLLARVQSKIDFTREFIQSKLIVGMNNVQNCLNFKISETDAFVTSSFKALAQC